MICAIKINISIAIVAYVYSGMLTEPDKLFAPLYRFLEKKLPSWLFAPIIGCEICVAGQLSLWYYIIHHHKNYDIEYHIYFISITILLTSTIKEFHTWMKKKAYN